MNLQYSVILNVKDMQDSFYNPTIPGFQFQSIDPRTRGVEGEAQIRIAPPVTLFGNFSWLPTARSADGDRLQRAPRFTYTVGVRGNTDLSPEFKLSGIASLLHSSSFLHQPASAPGDNASLPYTLLNARLELTYTPANLSMYISAANLTNETYRTFVFGSLLNLGQVGAYNEPRTITVGARINF